MAKVTQDYYELLGVARDATDAEIKRAFLAKARVMHPDVSDAPDAEARFKEINEAYSVLSDKTRRQNYDRFGDPDAGGFGPLEDIFSGFDMADLFSDFFGATSHTHRQSRGRDMAARVSVSLQEAAMGTHRTLAYDRLAPCDDCEGTGSADGEEPLTCPSCGGSGHQISWQTTILGRMQTQVVCPECHGTGTVIATPCATCDGQGRVPTHEVIEIEVPKGVRTGETLRVRGKGEAGSQGAPAGDLVVEVLVEDTPKLKRSGDDLVGIVDIDALEAILGCTVVLEGVLPKEKVTVNVPAGSGEGDTIRVSGFGMPSRGGERRGDFVGVVRVQPVQDLKPHEKGALRKVSLAHGGRVQRKKKKTKA